MFRCSHGVQWLAPLKPNRTHMVQSVSHNQRQLLILLASIMIQSTWLSAIRCQVSTDSLFGSGSARLGLGPRGSSKAPHSVPGPVRAMLYSKVTSVALWLGFVSQTSFATTVPSDVAADAQQKRSDKTSVEKVERADEAEELFARARKKYEAGDVHGALNDLEQCYALSHSVNLLYNLALLYNDLEDCTKALDYFHRYIREAADGERRDEANRQIAAFSEKCPPASPAPAALKHVPPQAAPATPRPVLTVSGTVMPRPQRWSTVGWIALGAGAVSGVTAAYFAVQAVEANHDTEQRPITADYYKEHSSDLTRYSTYAWVFGATSVLAMGVGVYVLAVAAPKQQDVSSGPTATVSNSAALVGYRLRF